jgi:nucleotide-binding universal stress UspA family protein
MLSIQDLLVGLEAPEAGTRALDEAILLARTFGARLQLAHVVTDVVSGDPGAPARERHARERLEQLAAEVERDGHQVARPHLVAVGLVPARALLSWTAALLPDLVVLGAGAKSPLERLQLGSTAERVVRRSSRPVWLARGAAAQGGPRRIVVAVDGSRPAAAALAAASMLARTFVAELLPLSVLPRLDGPLALTLRPPIPRARRTSREFKAALARIDLHGIPRRSIRRHGQPAAALLGAVEELEADLLVLGSANRTGLARLVRRNTAERVVRRARCSVLVVPSEVEAATHGRPGVAGSTARRRPLRADM